MKNMEGIQIIGTQRSGSNLLRVMLEQSPQITALHPPHILQHFVPLMECYDTMRTGEYEALVSHVVDFVKYNPVPWEGVELIVDNIMAQAKTRSVFELFKIVYETAARQRGTAYWCCKSMVNFKYFSQLEREGIRPKYIYLYRDGRDVALSFKKAVVGEKHIYHLAQQWRNDQLACIKLKEHLGPERCFSLCYETFIADPEREMKRLCEFLGIDYYGEMLDYHRSRESAITASSGAMWSNLTQPVISNNKQKFLYELSNTELEIFELVAAEALAALGYPLYCSGTKKELLDDRFVERYDMENQYLKQQIQNANAQDFQSRDHQRKILHLASTRNITSQSVL